MVVGGLLHSRFSQQDSRLISSTTLREILIIRISIRLLRLVGLTFTSGFFSKEQILIGQSYLFNSLFCFLLLLIIAGLTLSYCIKLFYSVSTSNSQSSFQFLKARVNLRLPILLLGVLRIVGGYILSTNLDPISFLISSMEGTYWNIIILGLVLLSISLFMNKILYLGFLSQSKLIDL